MADEKLLALQDLLLEDGPPGYSLAVGDSSHPKSPIHTGSSFEKKATNPSNNRFSKYYSACKRCKSPMVPTDYHYGCRKNLTTTLCVCEKCHSKLPNCQLHQLPLIKRTLKPWEGLPAWINDISPTPTKLDNPLIHALKSQDDNLTTFHARDPSLINAHTYIGYTPLHFAAHLGLVSGAAIFLAHGALTNSRDDANKTPLLVAIGHDQPQIVTLLLQNNVNIHSVGGFLDTAALHAAAANGFPELVSLLLDKGAMIDMPSGRGTALQLACQADSFKCASILLEKGGNPNAKCEGLFGDPPIVSAVRSKDSELVDLLIKYGADVNVTHEYIHEEKTYGLNPLLVAVTAGFRGIARQLLKNGANVNWRSNKEITCLIKAAGIGRAEMCRILIDSGADMNWENSLGMNALLFAAILGQEETMEVLLEKGASGEPPKLCRGKWKRIEKLFKKSISKETRSRILKRLREAKHR